VGKGSVSHQTLRVKNESHDQTGLRPNSGASKLVCLNRTMPNEN
jgi:hypothetical protein